MCGVLAATCARQADVIPLPCAYCGACTVPVLGRGTGPHAARANCGACGRFLRWVARADLLQKEITVIGSVNRVVLLGTISKYGVDVRYATSGTACASFMLVLVEVGQDAKEHLTLVPCEAWGKRAEAVSELEPGQVVLFEGKLARRKKGEQWELVVSGFDVTPITASLPTMTGSTN